ncbi:MAG TPA: hypothetical protein VMM36_15315 [Opitutaceae bacterium]|nr:hypothetical protein [Opitutaceae bacterium]
MNRPARKRHRWMTAAMAIVAGVALWLAWSGHRPRVVMDALPPALEAKP